MKMLFLLLLMLSSLARAQSTSSPDPFFARLQGEWRGEGTAFGTTAQVQQQWAWQLGGKFLRLSLRYETKSKDGTTQVFEGHGYYQTKGGGKYLGRWFDSQGNDYPINAQLEGEALVALWGGKVEGRSIYRLIELGNQMEASDSIKQADGSWKDFSRFVLKR